MKFIVEALPIAQPRPQPGRRGQHAMMLDVDKRHPVNQYKVFVRDAFKKAGGELLTGPVALWLTFVMPRPKAMHWKTKPMPRVWYTAKRNDWDNLGKSFCDALNTIAWEDDGQIAWTNIQRVVAAGGEQPHVIARIEALTHSTDLCLDQKTLL